MSTLPRADRLPTILPRRLLFGLLAGAALLAAGAAQAAGQGQPLRVAVEGEYPPFNTTDAKGKLAGFDVDIAQALCAAMQAPCQLVKQRWDLMISDLAAGKYEAVVSSMSISDERRKRIDFTEAYYQTPSKFVRKKGLSTDIAAGGSQGLKVGVQRATIHDQYLTDAYGDRVTIVRYATVGEAQADMRGGKLDLLFGDAMALSESFLKTPQGKGFEFTGPDVRDPRWFGQGFGIAVRKGNADLLAKLNQALATIRADGTYDRIESKYFPFDIGG
jgi:arginine/ornithine transport system substrate-binding protein